MASGHFCKPACSNTICLWSNAVMKLQVWVLRCMRLTPPRDNPASKGCAPCAVLSLKRKTKTVMQKPQKKNCATSISPLTGGRSISHSVFRRATRVKLESQISRLGQPHPSDLMKLLCQMPVIFQSFNYPKTL